MQNKFEIALIKMKKFYNFEETIYITGSLNIVLEEYSY